MNDMLIALVLDKSGSMGWIADETCNGVNAFFEDQRSQEGRALLSLTLFDTSFDVRYVAVDLTEVPDLGSDGNPYQANGGTALYDAVGTTIRGVEAWLAKNADFDGKVMCVIQTDGGENSSKTWRIEALNDLIADKTAQGWEFVFMGQGGAAWTEGQKFTSIPADNFYNANATPVGAASSYATLSTNSTNFRSGAVASMARPDADKLLDES